MLLCWISQKREEGLFRVRVGKKIEFVGGRRHPQERPAMRTRVVP